MTIIIDGTTVGHASPPYIIAELSANHNGDIQRALDTMTMAKKAGANAVKLQTYTPDTMTIDCNKEDFLIKGGLWDGYTLYQLYLEAHTPFEWHRQLFAHARALELTCFSTPFDESAVDLLEDLNAPAYKIASFEVTDLPLIRYVASTKKPIIMSTGMANLSEIEDAVATVRDAGCKELILLHCISAYPAPIEQSNLRTIPLLAKQFNVLSGLSDHTLGTTVAIAAIAMGACVIEKHVTLSRDDKGPDSSFSLEPNELKALCSEAHDAWLSLGKADFVLKEAEKTNLSFRRSIYVVEDIAAGERLTEHNIRRIRPGLGLPPKAYQSILGKRARVALTRGTPLHWELVDS